MESQRPHVTRLDAAPIRHQTDIVALASRYTTLKLRGQVYQGLCPLHTESTPSFTVYPHTQTYHRFGCGASGNAVNFVMATKGMPFYESLCELAGEDCFPELPSTLCKRTPDSRSQVSDIHAMVEALKADLQAQLRTAGTLAITGQSGLYTYLDRHRWLMDILELADEFAKAWNHCSQKKSEEMERDGTVHSATLCALKGIAGHVKWGRAVGVLGETETRHWTLLLERLQANVANWKGLVRHVCD